MSQPDIAVRYIFRRERWVDRIYGTGLEFVTDQVRVLPADIALKFLRHTDTFEVAAEVTVPSKTEEERTAEALAVMKKQREDEANLEQERHDLFEQINRMDSKESLSRFITEKFNVPIDKRHSVETLRVEAKGLVDRFGLP